MYITAPLFLEKKHPTLLHNSLNRCGNEHKIPGDDDSPDHRQPSTGPDLVQSPPCCPPFYPLSVRGYMVQSCGPVNEVTHGFNAIQHVQVTI